MLCHQMSVCAVRTIERWHHVSGSDVRAQEPELTPTDVKLVSHRPLCHSYVAEFSATTSQGLGNDVGDGFLPFIRCCLREDTFLQPLGKNRRLLRVCSDSESVAQQLPEQNLRVRLQGWKHMS